MLKIKYCVQKEALALSMEGHAGAGKWGSDIVCAAASVLAYTGAAVAQQLYREGKLQQRPQIKLEPGAARIILENSEAARGVLDVICTGYGLLAVRYPKNVLLVRE